MSKLVTVVDVELVFKLVTTSSGTDERNVDDGITDVGTEVVEATGALDLGSEITGRVVNRARVVLGTAVVEETPPFLTSRRFRQPTMLMFK